jgi:hypothetical protein
MNPNWTDLAADWFSDKLLLDGASIDFKEAERKVPRADERAEESARSFSGPRDDDDLK